VSAARGPVVLLEGVSDVVAVRSAAATAGVDLSRCRLVDMGGITNVRGHLVGLADAAGGGAPVLGLCDAAEAHVVVAALRSWDRSARGPGDLPARGFFVCEADLEDELLRALGATRAIGVLSRLGLQGKLEALRRQPAWRERPVHDQLHRFAGVASGRKALLAGALTAELAVEELPEPLALLVERLRHA
jgi:hypothetical protein